MPEVFRETWFGLRGALMARKRSHKLRKPLAQIIEEELSKRIVITINGVQQRTTVFGVIVFQLLQKALRGNRQAQKMLLRYHEFARSLNRNTKNFEVILVNQKTGKKKGD